MQFMAHALGSTPHRSALLRRLGGLGFRAPEQLLDLAVSRGCSHYRRMANVMPVNDPGESMISNEQLAVALCSAAQVYDPQLIRCAVQLLSAPDVRLPALVHLARQERCLPLLKAVARAASGDVIDVVGPWASLNSLADSRDPSVPAGRLPHATRFMIMAGRDRSGQIRPPRWLRRDRTSPLPGTPPQT